MGKTFRRNAHVEAAEDLVVERVREVARLGPVARPMNWATGLPSTFLPTGTITFGSGSVLVHGEGTTLSSDKDARCRWRRSAGKKNAPRREARVAKTPSRPK